MHFSKNLVVCSSAGPKILAFVSHCSANFQPMLDCFIPNFKLKYEDSENIKADRASTVVFNLHQIKRRAFFFFGTPGSNLNRELTAKMFKIDMLCCFMSKTSRIVMLFKRNRHRLCSNVTENCKTN